MVSFRSPLQTRLDNKHAGIRMPMMIPLVGIYRATSATSEGEFEITATRTQTLSGESCNLKTVKTVPRSITTPPGPNLKVGENERMLSKHICFRNLKAAELT